MQTYTATLTRTKTTIVTGILLIASGAAALIGIPLMQSPEEMNPREMYNELSAACTDDTCTQKIQECFSTDCYKPLLECLFYWTKDQCSFLEGDEYISCEENVRDQCVLEVLQTPLVLKKAPILLPTEPATSEACLDSDSGIDFSNKGTVISSHEPSGKEDYCYQFSDGSEYLMEGACLDNNYAQVQKNCKELGENLTCMDGVCQYDPIEKFFSNPKIKQAVGDLTQEERVFLSQSFFDLQTGKTASWEEYDDITKKLSLKDIKKIWLRRVAHSFYIEENKNVPWSLLNYSQADLDRLLSFCINGEQIGVFPDMPCGQGFYDSTFYSLPGDKYYLLGLIRSPNPIVEFDIGKMLISPPKISDNKIPDNISAIGKPRDAIEKFIIGMRKIGWGHNYNGSKIEYEGTIPLKTIFYTSLENPDKPQGSSWRNSLFLLHVLRSWNIPSITSGENKQMGHGNIIFTSENVGMSSGDDVQGLKHYPVEMSLWDAELLKQNYYLDACKFTSVSTRERALKLLSYLDKAPYNTILYYKKNGFMQTSFCDDPGIFKQQLLNELVNKKEEGLHCTKEQQLKFGLTYQPPFTEKEIDDWVEKIAAYAKKHNMCGTFNGLVLPLSATSTITFSPPPDNSLKYSAPSLTCWTNPLYSPTNLYELPPGNSPGTYLLNVQEIPSYLFDFFPCKKGALTVSIFDQKNKIFGSLSSEFFPITIKPQ